MTKPIIPEAALAQHIAILGKTRSGKSSVMRGLVEGILDREQPVCIVDPKGDWWGIKLARDGKRPGYPVVIFGGEHADVPINAHAGAHVAELFATGNRPCLIDLGGWMVGERTRFYIDFASTLFRLTKGMRWLVIDEIHNFAPKGKVLDPDAGKALHWTNRLASEGLGKGLPMLFASQRPQKVHNDTLTSAETLIAMRVLHPSDRGAVSDWIKGCGDLELGGKVLNSLAQMDRGEGWVWSPEIGLGPERVKFPMFKTYDSFRPQTAEDAAALKGWAEVDLEDVKAKLATVVKEAEANDPRLLRAENARLRAELTKKAAVEPAKKGTTPDERDRSYKDGYRTGHEHGYGKGKSEPRREDVATINALRKALEDCMKVIVKINAQDFFKAGGEALDKAEVEKVLAGAAQSIAKMVERHLGKRDAELDGLRREAQRVAARLKNLLEQKDELAVSVDVRHNEAFTVSPTRPAAPKSERQTVQRAPTDGFTGQQQRVLDALAWWASIGVDAPDKGQVGFIAGYRVGKSVGGTFGNILGQLRNDGLLDYPSPGNATLTDAGRKVARPPEEAPTTDALQRAIYDRLDGPESRVLKVLIDAYPDELTKQECGARANYTVGDSVGGTFGNILGRLRGLGLIDYPGPGKVVALPVLFIQ